MNTAPSVARAPHATASAGAEASAPARPTRVIRHAASGTCFPAPFGDLEWIGARIFHDDPSDASVDLGVRALGLVASIYIYPAAAYRTGADIDAHFAEVVADVVSHSHATLERSETITDPRFGEPGRRAVATFTRDNLPLRTEAVLYRRDGFYFKGRFTYPAFVESRVRPILDRILAQSFNPCDASPVNDANPAPGSLAALLGPEGAPRTPAQLDAIARLVRQLERDPSGVIQEVDPAVDPSGRHGFTLLLRWLASCHDVQIVITPWAAVLTGPDVAEVQPVLLGAMLGMAAYGIEHRAEHPDPASDAVQLAGIESATRWYEALVRDGAAPVAALDEMVGAREHGALPAWLAAHRNRAASPAAAPVH